MERVMPIPRRMEVIEATIHGGGSIAAVLPIHYPRALFRAFDLLPVEVWGPPGIDPVQGMAHLQPYVCSIVRNALSFFQGGGLDIAEVVVVPHTCDSLQGLGSVLLDFIPARRPVIPMYLPRGKRESDLNFFVEELHNLYRRLHALTGRSPDDDMLLHSILREEEADQFLAQIHYQRSRLGLADLALYRVIRSREYLPAEQFAGLARDVLARSSETARSGIPIVLSGIVPEPMSLLDAITRMGGIIAADDLACGGRRLYPVGHSREPFRRMAESLLYGPPDPTRGSPLAERCKHLLRLVEHSGARGVLFYEIKFCEPALFDLPILRQKLQSEDIPSLVIELDISDPVSDRVLTKIEAFLEMIA